MEENLRKVLEEDASKKTTKVNKRGGERV